MAKFNFSNAFKAYAFASLASGAAGGAVAYVIGPGLGWYPAPSLTISVTWLAVAGLPSLVEARAAVMRALGQRPGLSVSTSMGFRTATLGTVMESVIPAFRSSNGPNTIRLDAPETKQFKLKLDDTEYPVPESEMLYFLSRCWRRQINGEKGQTPFSRKLEVPRHMSRPEYEVRMALLLDAGLVAGRQERQSGRLIWPPRMALDQLWQHCGGR